MDRNQRQSQQDLFFHQIDYRKPIRCHDHVYALLLVLQPGKRLLVLDKNETRTHVQDKWQGPETALACKHQMTFQSERKLWSPLTRFSTGQFVAESAIRRVQQVTQTIKVAWHTLTFYPFMQGSKYDRVQNWGLKHKPAILKLLFHPVKDL